jgi:hypothetical protein
MARCVKCGDDAAEPVWAAYADPAFVHKPPQPFPLHQACFDDAARYLPAGDAASAWAARQIEGEGG